MYCILVRADILVLYLTRKKIDKNNFFQKYWNMEKFEFNNVKNMKNLNEGYDFDVYRSYNNFLAIEVGQTMIFPGDITFCELN